MTRRRALDWVLIVLLTVSWGVLFARATGEALRTQNGTLQMGVASASSADTYPTAKPNVRQPGQLISGDEITAVDGESLRGSSRLRFYDLATRAARAHGFTEITASRAGSPFTLRLSLTPRPRWLALVYSALLLLTALGLVVRAPDWHLARRNFAAMWCFAIFAAFGTDPGPTSEVTLVFASLATGSALTVWNLQDFTLSARPVPKLHRTFALPAAVLFTAFFVLRDYLSAPRALSDVTILAADAAFAGASIAGLARAYRRSGPFEQRQIRWVVFGVYVGLVGVVIAGIAWQGTFERVTGIEAGVVSRVVQPLTGLAVPLGVAVSVVGYRWLDIDRLISATAAYTIAGVAALGAAFAVVPRLATAGGPALGMDPGAAQWLINLLLAGAAAFAAHRYLRPPLDRRLFVERHRRVSGLEQLVEHVGRCHSAEELWKLASERIDALLEPESLVAYAREGPTFEPRFARGAIAAPSHSADSLLVRALERRGMPLAADSSELDPFDRAALETLGVALVMPIGTHENLLGFACLGRKRSGDIYTREETAQLAAVALRCAQVLRPVSEPTSAPPGVFRQEGELWTLSHGGKEIRLRDMRGLHYLKALLREPGREFAATDLVGVASGQVATGGQHSGLLTRRGLGDAGPVLDTQARAEYRKRLTALEAELSDAERCADLGRLERASDEREALLAELEAAGRGKRVGSDSERARVAVTKAIKVALEKIAERHPELGGHLSITVRRGYMCAYEPDPRVPVDWEL